MDSLSVAPVLIEEDLRLTAYRLQVARDMPQDPYRDALIAGLASRLNSLGREAGVPEADQQVIPRRRNIYKGER